MACTSGCPTPGAHTTWGECLRAKQFRIAYCQSHKGQDLTRQKRWDAELNRYAKAVGNGMQPDGTTTEAILHAEKLSDEFGVPYRGDREDLGLPPLAELAKYAFEDSTTAAKVGD